MELSKAVALIAVILLVVLTAGYARAEPSERQQAIQYAMKRDAAQLKREERETARREAQDARNRRIEAVNLEIAQRCHIKSVMSDAEIAACRAAYKLM